MGREFDTLLEAEAMKAKERQEEAGRERAEASRGASGQFAPASDEVHHKLDTNESLGRQYDTLLEAESMKAEERPIGFPKSAQVGKPSADAMKARSQAATKLGVGAQKAERAASLISIVFMSSNLEACSQTL